MEDLRYCTQVMVFGGVCERENGKGSVGRPVVRIGHVRVKFGGFFGKRTCRRRQKAAPYSVGVPQPTDDVP